MPDPFDHVKHRTHERGGGPGNSMRDAMLDEAARFRREVKDAMGGPAESPAPRRPAWKRLLRKH